jgi:hypothetical protein
MRCRLKGIVTVATAILVGGGCQSADAGFIGMPSMLGPMVKRIAFGNFTLAPMAFTQFCLRYADQANLPKSCFAAAPYV